MGMPAHETYWTLDMVRALPQDGQRYEVLDGILLVSPAPSYRHQVAVSLLYEILAPYTRQNGIGRTLTSPAEIELSDTRLVQPDVLSSRRKSMRTRGGTSPIFCSPPR